MLDHERKLKALRTQIDGIDKMVFKLLKKRFSLVRRIGALKKKANLPIFQKGRWTLMLREHQQRGEDLKLDKKFVTALMTVIHKESVKIQKRIRGEKV